MWPRFKYCMQTYTLKPMNIFIMLLEVPLAKLMVKLDPKIYRKYVTICSKGKLLNNLKMHKDIYGLLRSALLVYKELFRNLELYIFVINP